MQTVLKIGRFREDLSPNALIAHNADSNGKRARPAIPVFRSIATQTPVRIRLMPTVRIRMSALREFADDLCFALAVKRVDITAPVPGTKLIEVAIPKENTAPFLWSEAIAANALPIATGELAVPIGRNDTNEDLVLDLATMPHLLIGGASGSGKSMLLHGILNSLFTQHTPEQLGLVLIDPKRVEFLPYENLPHLLTPVISDVGKTMKTLQGAVSELHRRFVILGDEGTRDIRAYLQKLQQNQESEHSEAMSPMPYIIIVIDEFADLKSAYLNTLQSTLSTLLEMGPAVGMHLILSTSRPTANNLTRFIKAFAPARIAFRVATPQDSRAILGKAGAETLSHPGDLLYRANEDMLPVRYQGCYLSETDIEDNVKSVKDQHQSSDLARRASNQSAHYVDMFSHDMSEDDDTDVLYDGAEDVVREAGQASASLLQRRLGIGYGRAAKLLDILETRGVIGPADGAKPRKVLKNNVSES